MSKHLFPWKNPHELDNVQTSILFMKAEKQDDFLENSYFWCTSTIYTQNMVQIVQYSH